jgi:hypothetical protein
MRAKGPCSPKVAAYSSNADSRLAVPPNAIAASLYKDVRELEGQGHFSHTGAAFDIHSSPSLWHVTKRLLPNITAA